MRIKKVLSLAVVLAMVLTVVPMFGITASAEETKPDVSSLELVFNGAREGSFSDTPINVAYTDWSSETTDSDGHVNVQKYEGFGEKGTTIQFYAGAWDGNGGAINKECTVTAKTTLAIDAEMIVLEWYNEFNEEDGNYRTFTFIDSVGADIDSYEIDTNSGLHWKGLKRVFGYPVNKAKYTFVAVNNTEANTHSTFYYVNDKLSAKNEGLSGTFNGFGGIKCLIGKWNKKGRNYGFADLKIYSGSIKTVGVTVKIAEQGKESNPIHSFTENVLIGSMYTPNIDNYYIDSENSMVYKLQSVEPVEITAEPEDIVVTATPYRKISSEKQNLITNGSFENEAGNFDTTGWLSPQSNAEIPNPQNNNTGHFMAVKKDDGYYFESSHKDWSTGDDGMPTKADGNPTDGSWYLLGKYGDPYDGLCSLKRTFDLTPGASYVFSFDTRMLKGSGSGDNIHFGLVAEGKDISDENAALGEKTTGKLDDNWKTVSFVFVADENLNALQFRAWCIGSEGSLAGEGRLCFDNFKLYKLEPLDTQTEVKVTYKCGEKTLLEKYVTYEKGEDGVTFPERYLYNDGEIYYLPEVQLTESKEITDADGVRKVDHYTSKTPNVPFSVDGEKFYKLTEGAESVVVNGNFTTGDALGWTARSGNKNNGTVRKEAVKGVETNVLKAGNQNDNTIGQIWALAPATTYFISFDVAGVAKDGQGNLYASLVPSASAEAARTAATNNISSDNGDLLKDKWQVSTNWINYSMIYTSEAGTPYLSLCFAYMGNARLANVEIIPVEEVGSSTDITVSFKNEGTEVYSSTQKGLDGAEIKVPYQIVKGSSDEKNYVLPHDATKVADNGKVEVDVVPVKAFTWNKVNNVIHVQNPGDDLDYATQAVNASHDLNREGYAVIDNVPENANVLVLDAWFNNVNGDTVQYPKLTFNAVSGTGLETINLTEGEATTTALNKMFETPVQTVTEFDTTGAVPVPADHHQGVTVKVYVPMDLASLSGTGASIKMTTVSTQGGMITVYGMSAEHVDVPGKAAVELGYDEKSNQFRFLVTSENADSIKASVEGKGDQTVPLGDTDGLALAAEQTNAIYTFKGLNNNVEGEVSEPASIYSLLANALTNGFDANNKIKNIDAVNKVVSAGGLAFKTGNTELNTEAAMIFEFKDNTVSVKDALYNAGIILSKITYVAGEKTGEIESADGKSVDLTEVLTTQAIDSVITFEAVEFEFVETEIAESVDESADSEIDFIEEL